MRRCDSLFSTTFANKYMSRVPYSSAVDSVMYDMVCSRLDLSYALSVVSRYMVCTRACNTPPHCDCAFVRPWFSPARVSM